MTETLDQIVAIAASLTKDRVEVTRTSSIAKLELDSLDSLEFLVKVEDSFDVILGCGDCVQMETLADVARAVDMRMADRRLVA